MTDYLSLKHYYEDCLEKHGPSSPRAVAWPNEASMIVRFNVMKGLMTPAGFSPDPATILDFACGLGDFYPYLDYPVYKYTGIDISEKMVQVCKDKYPTGDFRCQDILKEPLTENFDYIIINGLFTVKHDMGHLQMKEFVIHTLGALWQRCNVGLAFNVMNAYKVDNEREDLFALSFYGLEDMLFKGLGQSALNNVIMRTDYALRETTCYLYK